MKHSGQLAKSPWPLKLKSHVATGGHETRPLLVTWGVAWRAERVTFAPVVVYPPRLRPPPHLPYTHATTKLKLFFAAPHHLHTTTCGSPAKPPDRRDWAELKEMRRPAFDGISAAGEGVVTLSEFLAIVAFKSQDRDSYSDLVSAIATMAGASEAAVEGNAVRVSNERMLRTLTTVGHRLRREQVQQVISIVDPHNVGAVEASRLADVLVAQR